MQRPECDECQEDKNRPRAKVEECFYEVDESRLLLRGATSACRRCRQKLRVCDEKRPRCTQCLPENRNCEYETIGESGNMTGGS